MLLNDDGTVPVHWWTHAPNFGDLLAPWLVRKITGRDISFGARNEPNYVVIGSILAHADKDSIVWGAGCFGTEPPSHINKEATYLAVRGPLSRNKLAVNGIQCPRVYGDPALLVPDFHRPAIQPEHEVGLVLRWSEHKWNSQFEVEGVKKIYLGSDDIEETLDAMLSCRRIVSSSLHGLILADAYGIPNAWLGTESPTGKEFKYWDYLISVNKIRAPKELNLLASGMTLERILEELNFDGRPIDIDLDLLRAACPFWPESASQAGHVPTEQLT